MNKSCEYCQYNGPYGSIINPCENCPNNDFMINDTFPIVQPLRETTDHITNKTYTTSTTGCRTNSNGAKINDVFATDLTTDLPTADKYRKSIEVPFTIGDKIRSISDEEIAVWLNAHVTDTVCDLVCGNDCEAMATYDKTFDEVCKDLIKKKLAKEWHE